MHRSFSARELVTSSAVYDGELTAAGLKHGKGRLVWDDGDVFEGEFENDKKVRGTFQWKGGDVYVGEWKGDLQHAKGKYIYRDGREYEGDWCSGYKDGKGVLRFPNGDRYQGDFVQDVCQGFGEYVSADGRIYRGEYHHDKKHGFGVLYWPNGEKTEGLWDNNLINGIAFFTDASMRIFLERWSLGTREGERVAINRTEPDMKALLHATRPAIWKPDSDFSNCFLCSTAFTLVNRRHHCRHCGYVFCSTCTTNNLAIPRIKFQQPERVCDECYVALKANRAEDSSPTFSPYQRKQSRANSQSGIQLP